MQNIETKYIKREIFKSVANHLDKPEITIITGSRQVGKTVLLDQLKHYLIKNKKISSTLIFYYNLDLVTDWEIFQNQGDFIEFLKQRSQKQKIYVFIDEAQKVPEASRFFKGVYDSKLNAKLILTGSSSLEIKAKFKETLTGRKAIFSLSPFSFFEFLGYKNKILKKFLESKNKINKIDESKIIKLYKEYLVFGGYPRVVLAKTKNDKQNILKEIYSSYVERDAIGFLDIKNKSAYIRLLKLLAAQIGQLVNIDELAMNLGIDRHTVEKYILALEDTFIIKKITPYFRNKRQEIIKANKIYFLDLGIRNLALEDFKLLEDRSDKGSILENSVLNELLLSKQIQGGKLYFWRTKQKTEVDFILEKGLELLPIEIKWIVGKRDTIPAGLNNFINKFDPNHALIVNLSKNNTKITINQTKINFIYPFELRKFSQRN